MISEKNIASETVYCPTTTTIKKGVRLEAQVTKENAINYKLYIAVFTVNILAFAAGNAHAWPSSAMLSLKSKDTERNPLGAPITSSEESWIVSFMHLGSAVATIFAGYISDRRGRRTTLLIFVIPWLLSHICLIFATTVSEFLLWRFIMGVGIGSIHAIIPIYVGEVSEIRIRGFLGNFLQILYTLGLLFVYTIAPFISLVGLSIILTIPLGLCLIIFRSLVPESPHYYVNQRNLEAAEMSLSKLRTTRDQNTLFKELSDIEEIFEESRNMQSMKQILRSKSFRKGITISMGLMFFQQFSGVHVFISYLESIFALTDGAISSSTSSSIVILVRLGSVLVGTCLVDIWGRKVLLIISSTFCGSSLATIGLFFWMKNNGVDMSIWWWLPVFSSLIYMIGFSFGLGPLPWTLLGELFSNSTKALASSISTFTAFFLSFVVTITFRSLEHSLGLHGAFWFFAVQTVIGLIFIVFYVPETKGKSFQEVQRMLER
ncbi:hypothetical protein WA026_000469 [Henosepilachna vigintioctopunctata]|uniref:Major facilitator superfamily (MFS) profile domain-containing protein n=1 Tax=Henosepilachna vigintioctopunctata TaxID=420089 RepID=A0AAW1V867_9CUCU